MPMVDTIMADWKSWLLRRTAEKTQLPPATIPPPKPTPKEALRLALRDALDHIPSAELRPMLTETVAIIDRWDPVKDPHDCHEECPATKRTGEL